VSYEPTIGEPIDPASRILTPSSPLAIKIRDPEAVTPFVREVVEKDRSKLTPVAPQGASINRVETSKIKIIRSLFIIIPLMPEPIAEK
jgi:hypothetical protein